MTIEEMRKEMRREVVPEEVVPQNVINCLIDEDAEPPKPDAFSFLMRLRALGIGSGDFLDLLEGCDAPESVVNKIRQNPAMNLQGLIMTLENSELTPDDYTRMLLTARQVWERTLTLRLEKSEKISQEVDISEDDEPVKVYGEEPAPEEDEEYDEDMLELSFTAILDKIHSEAPSEPEDEEQVEPEEYEEQPEENTDSGELSFTAAFDKIKSQKHVTAEVTSETGEVSEGTSLVEINGDLLRENFGDISDDAESGEVPERPVKTAKQKKTEQDIPEKPVKTAKQKKSPPDETDDTDDTDAKEEENEDHGHVYHSGAIIAATIGAVVLVGAGFYIGHNLPKGGAGMHYSADDHEIFNKIHDAYEASTSGGELAVGFEEDHNAIFGDLLIDGGDGEKGVSSFSIGGGLYSVTEEAISVSIVENGTVTPLEDLLPPENSRFVAAFDGSGELYALFSGTQSGFMKIADGKAEYTVRQDGVLTSYERSDGEIRLGTVYTPVFKYTFTIDDEDVYLPKLGVGEPRHISADKVIVSDTDGYSYGVSAGYSTDNGSVTDVCAVIGDPVAASANGRFALNGEKGVLIKTDGDKITEEQTLKLVKAAFGEDVCAIVEDGSSKNVKLLDGELKTSSILTGITATINSMRFDGSLLTVSCENSVYRVDCSDAGDPKPLKLKTVNGIIAGRSALTCEANGTSLLITRYDLNNGNAEKIGEYSRELTSAATLGDPKTAVIDGARSGVAYSYFDGVSVISEYVVFADGEKPKTVSVFDDRTGFTAAFDNGGTVNAVCAGGVKVLG